MHMQVDAELAMEHITELGRGDGSQQDFFFAVTPVHRWDGAKKLHGANNSFVLHLI